MRTFLAGALAVGSAALAVAIGCAGPVAAAPSTCPDLGGVLDGQMCRLQSSQSGYTVNITFPADYPDPQPIADYIRQTRDGFLNVARMPGGRDQPYELDTVATQYSSGVPPRGTQSVVLKTFQDVGGAHPQTFFKTFTWDLGLRKPVTIDTLFKPGADPYPQLLAVVQSELSRQSGMPVTIAAGDGLDPQKYQNFALTDDALIFFFGQGELLPESAGALQVSVPRGPIDALIS